MHRNRTMTIHDPSLTAALTATDYFAPDSLAAPAVPLRALTALEQAYAYWGSDEDDELEPFQT
jgi:hypothetical protein